MLHCSHVFLYSQPENCRIKGNRIKEQVKKMVDISQFKQRWLLFPIDQIQINTHIRCLTEE